MLQQFPVSFQEAVNEPLFLRDGDQATPNLEGHRSIIHADRDVKKIRKSRPNFGLFDHVKLKDGQTIVDTLVRLFSFTNTFDEVYSPRRQ